MADDSFRFFNATETNSHCHSAETQCGLCGKVVDESFGLRKNAGSIFGDCGSSLTDEFSWLYEVNAISSPETPTGYGRESSLNKGSAYELSMRDLVEPSNTESSADDIKRGTRKLSYDVRQSWEQKRKVYTRSNSVDNGALLKVFLPVSLLGRSKSSNTSGSSQKVMPQPQLVTGSIVDNGVLVKNEVSLLRRSKRDDGNASKSRKITGCYSFFNMKRSKDAKL